MPPMYILPLHFDYSTPIATATVDLSQHLPSGSKPLFTLIKDAWNAGSLENLSNLDGYDMDSRSDDQYQEFIPPEYLNHGKEPSGQQKQRGGDQESPSEKYSSPFKRTRRRLLQEGQRVSLVSRSTTDQRGFVVKSNLTWCNPISGPPSHLSGNTSYQSPCVPHYTRCFTHACMRLTDSGQGLCATHAPVVARRPVPAVGRAPVGKRQRDSARDEDAHAACAARLAAVDTTCGAGAMLRPRTVHRDLDGKEGEHEHGQAMMQGVMLCRNGPFPLLVEYQAMISIGTGTHIISGSPIGEPDTVRFVR